MFGKYKHSVDEKGRLFVPSKLREELGSTFYVTLGLDHCLVRLHGSRLEGHCR